MKKARGFRKFTVTELVFLKVPKTFYHNTQKFRPRFRCLNLFNRAGQQHAAAAMPTCSARPLPTPSVSQHQVSLSDPQEVEFNLHSCEHPGSQSIPTSGSLSICYSQQLYLSTLLRPNRKVQQPARPPPPPKAQWRHQLVPRLQSSPMTVSSLRSISEPHSQA